MEDVLDEISVLLFVLKEAFYLNAFIDEDVK